MATNWRNISATSRIGDCSRPMARCIARSADSSRWAFLTADGRIRSSPREKIDQDVACTR
jgi:hypothetical protein